jgi:hypothetical protein
MARRHTGIAVIESRWFEDKNTSTRGVFDLISDLEYHSPHRYHYEMAGGKDALKEAINRISWDPDIRYLCIASHGDGNGIHLHNDEVFTPKDLGRCVAEIGQSPVGRLHGIHLSACIVGTERTALSALSMGKSLGWVSGYTTQVGWIDSAALDLLFFQKLALLRKNNRAVENIRDVADELREQAGGLIDQLGFGIYVRHNNGVRNLVAPSDEEANFE